MNCTLTIHCCVFILNTVGKHFTMCEHMVIKAGEVLYPQLDYLARSEIKTLGVVVRSCTIINETTKLKKDKVREHPFNIYCNKFGY